MFKRYSTQQTYVAVAGVAVTVIVIGGGHVELKTLELGFEDVDGDWVETTVLRVEAGLVVERGALELLVCDDKAELDVLEIVVVVVVWKYDDEETLIEYEVVTW